MVKVFRRHRGIELNPTDKCYKKGRQDTIHMASIQGISRMHFFVCHSPVDGPWAMLSMGMWRSVEICDHLEVMAFVGLTAEKWWFKTV